MTHLLDYVQIHPQDISCAIIIIDVDGISELSLIKLDKISNNAIKQLNDCIKDIFYCCFFYLLIIDNMEAADFTQFGRNKKI